MCWKGTILTDILPGTPLAIEIMPQSAPAFDTFRKEDIRKEERIDMEASDPLSALSIRWKGTNLSNSHHIDLTTIG
jgi:hypothetical protein